MEEIYRFLVDADQQLLLAINGCHNGYFDNVMFMVSSKWTWIPLYASIIYVIFRNTSLRSTLLGVLLAVSIIVFADQISSAILKPMVCRLRPSNLESPIGYLVHVVDGYRGGPYGFPSSHAANCWGLAFFVLFYFRRMRLTVFMMVWAAFVSYSRMYLGVHYPGDILVGMLLGIILAVASYFVFQKLFPQEAVYFHPNKKGASMLHIDAPVWVGVSLIVFVLIAAFFFRYR